MSIFKMAEKTTKDINAEIASLPHLSDQIKKWAKNSENVTRQKAMLETARPVSYTHLRAHETDSYLVCRLLLEKKQGHDPRPLSPV